MKFTQIRNATIIVEYNHIRFLIDPALAAKGTYPSFSNAPRQEEGNPSVELPFSKEKIINNIDAVILTHLHSDHFDDVAKETIPKHIKVFVQNRDDYLQLEKWGFSNIEVLSDCTKFNDIELIKTKGQHGKGEILKRLGEVSGIVFRNQNEKTLYVAGDTVWYDETEKVMTTYHPEVVVANAGANRFFDSEPLVMDKNDLYELHKAAPNSIIIASHMEAYNHWSLSRKELREFTVEKEFDLSVLIPKDGESYTL